MGVRLVGKCSECGGNVTVATAWAGLEPPVPTCQSCGAEAELPTVKMSKKKKCECRPEWIQSFTECCLKCGKNIYQN